MGSFIGIVGSYQLCSTIRVQTICLGIVHSGHSYLLEFAYGDPGYAAQLAKLSTLWNEPQWVDLARHCNNIASGYIEWNSNRARDVALSARDHSVHLACPLLERMPTKLELLKWELEIEKKKNSNQDSNYQAELGQCWYFLKIEKDKVKDERKERELLLEDFKSLGLKNKRLEDELKGRKGNPDKRIKLTENIQRDLEEARSKRKRSVS